MIFSRIRPGCRESGLLASVGKAAHLCSVSSAVLNVPITFKLRLLLLLLLRRYLPVGEGRRGSNGMEIHGTDGQTDVRPSRCRGDARRQAAACVHQSLRVVTRVSKHRRRPRLQHQQLHHSLRRIIIIIIKHISRARHRADG